MDCKLRTDAALQLVRLEYAREIQELLNDAECELDTLEACMFIVNMVMDCVEEARVNEMFKHMEKPNELN